MHSTFARGTIRIEEEEKLVSNEILYGLLLVLIAVLVFYQFRSKR